MGGRNRVGLRVVVALALGASVPGGRPASAGFLDPSAFASLGAFPTTPGQFTVVEGSDMSGPYARLTGPGGLTLAGTLADGVAVFDFDTINLNAGQTLTYAPTSSSAATFPVALLSRGDVTIAGALNFEGSAVPNASLLAGFSGGPGGGIGGAGTFGGSGPGGGQSGNPFGAQGGGGGGFANPGGAGGAGAGLQGAPGGGGYGDLTTALQGGSGGGAGSSSQVGPGGKGGGGGGGVEIGALGAVTVTGSVDVRGSAGGIGTGSGLAVASSGGGGGSGGGILIDGGAVTITGTLLAAGAAGGQGGASLNDGSGGGGGAGGRIVIGYGPGLLDLRGASLSLLGGAGGLSGGGVNASAGAAGQGGTFTTVAVPEPSSWALLGTGLGAAGLTLLRKRLKADVRGAGRSRESETGDTKGLGFGRARPT